MADDKSKRGAQDRARINVKQSFEVRYWTKALGCTRATLQQAVKVVGPMVKDVKRWLIKQIEDA